MAESRAGGLHIIFAIFLGLMVTAFIGVGVYTFYPSPADRYRDSIIGLDRQQQSMHLEKPDTAITAADRARMLQITKERDRLQDESMKANKAWGGRTSIILVLLATLAMAISLVNAVRLPVISNGLLLGGVFTMLYGVGWVIASGTSNTRFFVMTFALFVTIALGYMRFVRRREAEGAVADREAGTRADTTQLEQRVAALEDRLRQVASALTQDQ